MSFQLGNGGHHPSVAKGEGSVNQASLCKRRMSAASVATNCARRASAARITPAPVPRSICCASQANSLADKTVHQHDVGVRIGHGGVEVLAVGRP